MTTMRVTLVNTTNEDLVPDRETRARVFTGPSQPLIAAHGTGRFRMGRHVSYLVGGDPDRAIYLQTDGAVWAPPTCVVRTAADDGRLEVQVSPAPWSHPRPGP